MKQYLLAIIAVLAAVILALSSFDTADNPYPTRSYRTYCSSPGPNARPGGNTMPQLAPIEAVPDSAMAPVQNEEPVYDGCSTPPIENSGSALPPVVLSADAMTELTPVQLPPLDAGMVNVTSNGQSEEDGAGQAGGYRLSLPVAGSECRIVIPYDPSLLPQGFTEDDIQTYVYDRQYRRWVAIQRDSVNEAELLVCSRFRPWEKGLPHTQDAMVNPQDALTQVQDMMSPASQGGGGGDSPLDFINAVLKTPEMPEASAYTPTSIKELKAADPLEGLTLMQPPTANNSGTANLSYPIEIPAGRQGMQPSLALTYSSGGGNGWLGVGWDIPIPSITVETRWGVPRYDRDKESEVYVYEGEQLVTMDGSGRFREMPHRTNQWADRQDLDQDGHEQFYPRRNEAFDSIMRHGSGPDSYWWSVTHKNGVTDYYGKRHDTDSADYSGVLCDPATHNIAQWMLTESIDPDGNWVRYYYGVERHKSVTDTSINLGIQIYADSIVYTGHDSTQGRYSIKFNRHNSSRRDIITNGRYGFREVTAATLCNIEVLYNESILRRYYFVTENTRESNSKTRLTDIVRMDPPIQNIPCTDIFNPSYWVVSDSTDVCGSFGKIDLLRYNFSYFDYPAADSLFGSAVDLNLTDDYIRSSFDYNEHEAMALGATSGKDWSVGGTVCFGFGSNPATSSNSVGGNFTYSRSRSKGLLTLLDIDGDGHADKIYKKDQSVFYRKNIADGEYMFHYGDEKIELEGVSDFLDVVGNTPSFGVQGHFAVFNANAGVPVSISDTKVYFADVNADGLPDIVTDKGILFNNLDGDGHAYFSAEQTLLSESPLGQDSSFITSTAFGDCEGGIIHDGYVNERILCDLDYGIQTEIFHDSLSWENLQSHMRDLALSGYDIIGYTDTSITFHRPGQSPEVSGCPSGGNEPDLDAVRVWVAPKYGWIELTSTLQMVEDHSESAHQSRHRDGVTCAVQHNPSVHIVGNTLFSDAPELLWEHNMDPDDPEIYVFKDTLWVSNDDILFFRLKSGNSRLSDRVYWKQHIRFMQDGACFDSEDDFILTGRKRFQAPKRGQVTVTGDMERLRSVTHSPCTLRICRQDTVKVSVTLGTGETAIPVNVTFDVDAGDSVVIAILAASADMDWGSVSFVPELTFVPDPSDTSLVMEGEVVCHPDVATNVEQSFLDPDREYFCNWFGPLYNGWGQFAYNNNFQGSSELPIDVERLIIPTIALGDSSVFNHSSLGNTVNDGNYHADTTDSENPEASFTPEGMASDFDNLYNPLSANTSWVSMLCDGEHGAYAGFGGTTFVTRSEMHNTRQPVIIPLEDYDTDNDYDEDGNLVTEIPVYDDVLPVGPDGSSMKHVRKRSLSTMANLGAGISAGPNFSVSLSIGGNEIVSDYTDLNGDRYPDILVKNSVQYTRPWGGVDTAVQFLDLEDKHVGKSLVWSYGVTAGGEYPDPYREPGNNPPLDKMAFRGASLSGSRVDGGDNTTLLFADINGDGLPDQVWGGKKQVSLNTGYGFETPETWNMPDLRQGRSSNGSFSGGISFSYNQKSIGGGIGKNMSESETKSCLMDINGDGLPDHVKACANSIAVRYNYGNGNWSPAAEYVPGIAQVSRSVTHGKSGSLDVTLGFLFSAFKFTAGVQMSPSNKSFTTDCAQLVDVNGDGYPDFVTSGREDEMSIRYNRAGKTNLLRKVTNFTGSTIELDYDMPLACFEKPQRSWNLASVQVEDPATPVGGGRSLTRFGYGTPNYNRYERSDFGYDTVVTRQYDTDGGDTLYRYMVEVYENRNLVKRGRKTYDCLLDASGRKFVEHEYEALVSRWVGNAPADDGTCAVAGLFVQDEISRTSYYEGELVAKVVTREQREYDTRRNVIRYSYGWDDMNHPEGFMAEIHYAQGMARNMTALPIRIEVRGRDSSLLQLRTAAYTSSGRLMKLVNYASPTDTSVYDFAYDAYGNLIHVTFPENASHQRLEYAYQYDTLVHSYPVRVENLSLGFVSASEYDYRFGKPTRTTDINGNEMRYEYDLIGRLHSVIAPYEIDSGIPYTVSYTYNVPHYGVREIWLYNQQQPLLTWSCTRHFDPQDTANDICVTTVCDNLGRPVQTKRDAEIGGQEKKIVSGRVVYDCFGRTMAHYLPIVDSLLSDTFFSPSYGMGAHTAMRYDVMDRTVYVKDPLNYVTTTEYGFGMHEGRWHRSTATTDALGNTVTVLAGLLGKPVRQSAPLNTVTLFEYDPIGQLTATTDPDGFSTTYTYDMLGRMIQRVHPDAGIDWYRYDPAGNIILHANRNEDTVLYTYHYSLPTGVSYSRHPANNIRYWYGGLGAPDNCAGKVAIMEDGSGLHAFKYGKLGEVTEETRIFVLPNDDSTYTFRMNFAYDSWNRIQNITYPDGEVVTYHYDRGGMLRSIHGDKHGDTLTYIRNITYNTYGLKETITYGNGANTIYAYDFMMRLKHLHSKNGQGEVMQEIDYSYDSVGNITDISNAAAMLANGLGGDYHSQYVYDNLYRLTHAEGDWNSRRLSYSLNMRFHSNGRIGYKGLFAEVMDHTGNISMTNYAREYLYHSVQPNTLESVTDSISDRRQDFLWDAAGNMTDHFDFEPGCARLFCWDEENRLMGFSDCHNAGFYQYDANGERTYKLTGKRVMQNVQGQWFSYNMLENPTLYTSPYLVADRKGYTKHYYAESERVASRIGGGGLNDVAKVVSNIDDILNDVWVLEEIVVGDEEQPLFYENKKSISHDHITDVMTCMGTNHHIAGKNLCDLRYIWRYILDTVESNCYWYHPDHLGSSSWITYTDGSAVQHLHYLPWGEDFVDQRTTNWHAMHTFSAKEKDSETGLSYFGARYYSSDLSIWLSIDPQASKYPSLNPYVYCADNPIKLVDPNGEEIGDIYNLLGVHIGWDGKADGKVYLFNTLSSEQLSITESAVLTSSPRTDIVNVTEKYGLYNYELNLRAILSMLKQAEAGSSNAPLSYNSWNSGDLFTSHSYSANPKDYQKHPGMNPNSQSSASGAYQFLSRFYSMPDFSPISQDKAALKLMTTKGYNAAIFGDVPSFVKESKEHWTSLKEWNIRDLQSTFNAYRAMELHGISTIAIPRGSLHR